VDAEVKPANCVAQVNLQKIKKKQRVVKDSISKGEVVKIGSKSRREEQRKGSRDTEKRGPHKSQEGMRQKIRRFQSQSLYKKTENKKKIKARAGREPLVQR